MKTAIEKPTLKVFWLSILIFSSIFRLSAFQINDTIYILHKDNMVINEVKYTPDEYHITVNMALTSKGDDRITTYEFKIYNINKDFKWPKFNKIGDTIPQAEVNHENIKSLKDLSKLNACDLLFLLADTKNVFLLKVIGKYFIRYELQYLSTKRGWLLDTSGFRY